MNDAAALAIQIERPVIATEDRRSFDGYLARPANERGPGLVIFSEMWGVAPSKTEMAEDYAKRGWCAYVPNMFWRSEFTGIVPFEEADQAWQRFNAFDWQRAADDARVAVQWLRTQAFSSGKVAAIGFCMGGRTAFLAAVRGGVHASISLYALGIAKYLDELQTITTPLQLHYGLNDAHIPKSDVDAVIAAAKGNRNVEVYLYAGAEHGFFTKGRPAFNAEAVAAASVHIERMLAAVAGDDLARLPQFEPRPIPFADLQEYDVQVQREQGIDVQVQGKQRIDDVLSEFMAPYIRDATKLEPFLNDAKRAIAGYVGARETEYDRRKAKKLLSATSIALETTKRKLQEIARWPELSNYLKRLHRDSAPTERPEPSSQEQVEKELQRRAHLDRSYSDFAPDQIAWRLSQLETVVSLADERVSFGSGDAQRDQIAQDFTDQLASAWHSATERKPTYSRPTPRLKNPSPFARLLETINQKLLKEHHRSPNNFFEYGAKAIKRLRQLIEPDC
jgi:carboxymethylenebutenolidase